VADGDQHVLEPMARRLGVVNLVGDDRGQARFLGQAGQLGDEPVVVGQEMVLELEDEARPSDGASAP